MMHDNNDINDTNKNKHKKSERIRAIEKLGLLKKHHIDNQEIEEDITKELDDHRNDNESDDYKHFHSEEDEHKDNIFTLLTKQFRIHHSDKTYHKNNDVRVNRLSEQYKRKSSILLIVNVLLLGLIIAIITSYFTQYASYFTPYETPKMKIKDCSHCHTDNGAIYNARAKNPHSGAHAFVSEYTETCKVCHDTSTFISTAHQLYNEDEISNLKLPDNPKHIDPIKLSNGTMVDPSLLLCKTCHKNVTNYEINTIAEANNNSKQNSNLWIIQDIYSIRNIIMKFNPNYANYARFKDLDSRNSLLKSSAVCVACHVGTTNWYDTKDENFVSIQEGNGSLKSPSGIFLQFGGYEFPEQNYDIQISNSHATMSNGANNGPCISCHYSANPSQAGEHSFKANKYTCVSCHSSDNLGDFEVKVQNNVNLIKKMILITLQKKGVVPSTDYISVPVPTDIISKITDDDNLRGAIYNYFFIKNNIVTAVHNPIYINLLVFDTIDYLDNLQLDGQINIRDMDDNPFPDYVREYSRPLTRENLIYLYIKATK